MFHIVISLIVALMAKLADGVFGSATVVVGGNVARISNIRSVLSTTYNQTPYCHPDRTGPDQISLDQPCLRLREKPPNIPSPAVTSASAMGSETILMRMVRSMSLLAC